MVTTPLLEKKLLTTEKVITSDNVQKLTEKITTREEVVKCTDEVHKRTNKITANEEVDKGTEKLKYMEDTVVTIRRKDLYKFEYKSKGYTGLFNLDHEFLNRKFSTLELEF